jgi:hypothetical protein
LSLNSTAGTEVFAVDGEDIEDHVGSGMFTDLPNDAGGAAGEPLLQQIEVEPGTIPDDDLAVENSAAGDDSRCGRGYFGEPVVSWG